MKRSRNNRRTAAALGLSTAFHVVILAFIVSQVTPEYQLPESVTPPEDVTVVQMPEPPPKPVFIEKPAPPKPRPAKPTPVKQVVPKPTPPVPAQPTPAPNPPTPIPKPPTPIPPKPSPPQQVVAKPLPAVAPTPLPKPPTPTLAPTTRAPAAPAPPAPAARPTPLQLNIHKPEKEAPGSVATLPFAPAAAPASPAASAAAAAAAAGEEPPLGGSRLNGLTPYPYGAMPSGGSGLRGTLVGCANADAVSLSPAERARCNERFGSEAAKAPALDTMSPTKRAAFDKAEERQNRELDYRKSGMPPGTTVGGPGGHMGGMSSEPALTIHP